MALYRCFDAAYPPAKAPAGMQAVLGYIGRQGYTPHVWTLAEWQRFGGLRYFPCWVPDYRRDAASEADAACDKALSLGWASHQNPARAIIADYEMEGENIRGWHEAFADKTASRGFDAVAYGSASTVFHVGAEHLWVAAWDGRGSLPAGETVHAHQLSAFAKYDVSVVDDWLWARAGQGPRHG